MSKVVKTMKKSALVMKDKAVHGVKVAASAEAQKLLMKQVRSLCGGHFPDGFYETPIGRCMMDMASCYLVHMLADSFENAPGAQLASQGAELAMEAVSRDSITPLISMGKGLLSGLGDSFKDSGLVEVKKD